MAALKSAKAILFAAIAVTPFLMVQMGYDGRIIRRIGTMPGVFFYVVSYLAVLNVVDQVLTVIYVHPFREMPDEMQRKWKVLVAVLVIIAISSGIGLIVSWNE